MKAIKPLKGFATVSPDGTMSGVVAGKRSWCRVEAAMAHQKALCCQMPKDWIAARKAGYRVVPVVVIPTVGNVLRRSFLKQREKSNGNR